ELNPLAPVIMLLGAQSLTFGVRPLLLCYDQEKYAFYWPLVRFDAGGFRFAAVCGLLSTISVLVGYRLAPKVMFDALEVRDLMPRTATFLLVVVGIVLAMTALGARMDRARVSFEASDTWMGRMRGDIGKETVGYGYETFSWAVIPVYLCALASQFL